jgi:hypothetical protein
MKRALAPILALALTLASVPSQAQVALGRVTLQTSAPAPVPALEAFAPSVGAFTPALSAPSLIVTSAVLAPIPLQPASVIPAIAVAPLPAPARAETPLTVLRVVAAPDAASLASAAFDGQLAPPAASSVEPPLAPEPAAKPRPSLLQRSRGWQKKNPLRSAFNKAMFATAVAGVTAPILWGAAPAQMFGYALGFAGFLALKTVVPLAIGGWIWRKLRGAPTAAKPPPGRRAKLAASFAGIALGLAFAYVPYHTTGPTVERASATADMVRAPENRKEARWISGGAVEQETVKELSKNAVGREVLDGLRDRGGVIRLPTFYITRQSGSYAEHDNLIDGVYLNENEITDRGWTVEQFFKDPTLQRRLVRESSWLIVHELVHAVQGRRPPWTAGYFSSTFEAEQEAFLRQTMYLVAQLEADPAEKNDSHHAGMLEASADDLDAYLASVAKLYPNNVSVPNRYYDAFVAARRASWPEYRVRVYKVLAARAESPESAKMYMDKAKAAAAR